MGKQSAGLLMYRRSAGCLEVFLIHPGGPFWARKDVGAWAIPKGEYTSAEDPLGAAQREFNEETSFTAHPPFLALGAVTQRGGKRVVAWAFEGDCDPSALHSNTCQIEWPPRSGKQIEIPEVDQGRWFSVNGAREKMRPDQFAFVETLLAATP